MCDFDDTLVCIVCVCVAAAAPCWCMCVFVCLCCLDYPLSALISSEVVHS